MTLLDDEQEKILRNIKDTLKESRPVLEQLEEDYEYAVYRAKKTVRDEIQKATDSGIPMRRVVEVTKFQYPQKLKAWLQPSKVILDRLANDLTLESTDSFDDSVKSIESVTRNPKTGKFEVDYKDKAYVISAMGPDTEAWSSREDDIPQGVYDLITSKFPGYVVLDEEED